jgi:hypothetical protein
VRVVHILRKPLSEGNVAQNVVRHGTGGMNIDASRISTTSDEREEMLHMSQGFVGRKLGRPELMNYGYESSMAIKTVSIPNPHGRWPANLILQHLDGCRNVGVRRVWANQSSSLGSGRGHGNTPGNGIYYGVGGQVLASTADVDGMETVEAWECGPGCPVAGLDAATGELLPQGSPKRSPITSGSLGWGTGQETFYGDAGGASRFFKQVGGVEK